MSDHSFWEVPDMALQTKISVNKNALSLPWTYLMMKQSILRQEKACPNSSDN